MPSPVPIINVAPLIGGEAGRELAAVVAGVSAACRDVGAFQVINHGISESLIQCVWRETRRFFALPRGQKLAISRTKENSRGYYDRELTKNARDLKEVFDFGVAFDPSVAAGKSSAPDDRNRWPAALPAFQETMEEYFAACHGLGLQVLRAFCLGLDLPGELLHRQFQGDHTSFIRLNYYPLADPLAPEESAAVTPLGDMALHHHTDAGALTILLQDDVGGLQVSVDGVWVDVEPVDGALVVNTADMMQVWSNDLYKAALHRVLPRTERERYSIPFFFNPSYATDYAPLETVIGDGPRYRIVNWGEFREARADGDYGDYGREIQIQDYRV
ncbi:MAG: hypothetical protein O7I93_15200 [Gemmatimonadetes bacterium]|nr:hypothetical protein [Gemmatimonadota bacterium]